MHPGRRPTTPCAWPPRPTAPAGGAGQAGQPGGHPSGDRGDRGLHPVPVGEVNGAAALVDHGAGQAPVGATEAEHGLVAVLGHQQDVGPAADRGDELRRQRVEVVGVIHHHQPPGSEQLPQVRVRGQRVQGRTDQLGGVQRIGHVGFAAPHTRAQRHLLLVSAEESGRGLPGGPSRALAEPRQLARADPSFQ